MSAEFDKVSYWRERSMKRFQDLSNPVPTILKEIRSNLIHIEGEAPVEWDKTVEALHQDLLHLQGIIITMGKPRIGGDHEEKNVQKDNPAAPAEGAEKKT